MAMFMTYRTRVRAAGRSGASLCGAAILTLAAGSAQAQPFADASRSLAKYTTADTAPRVACESLSGFKRTGLVQVQARTIAASADHPAHCRVSGVIAPEIAFEVNLPAMWNGRFYMIGNGGHAGESPDDANRASQRAAALQNGFAMASTNTGHDSRKETGATFVLSNPQKAIDYAYRAVHEAAAVAKQIAAAYYAQPPKFSYWNSCSNGGRQGLIEAQRYPDDFDGIVANAPWVSQTGFTVGAIWNQRALDEAPLSAAKMELVAKTVIGTCDAVDGLTDGLIDDPRACRFDATRDIPACSQKADASDCLTAAQAAAVNKIYSGPVTRGGRSLFPGFAPGSEAVTAGRGGGPGASGWMNMIVPGGAGRGAADFSLAEGTMKYLVFDPPRPDYDYRTFDFDRDPALLERWGKLANADNPDLAAFRRRGGKLLMTYGWADTILQPMMGVDYYERATKVNGPGTPEFFRLFMVPGMAHCSGGVGPDQHDPMTAIIDWVEKGKAPDTLVATKVVDNKAVRSRPLCPYPQVARYSGTGSIDDAANFRCEVPKGGR
jgi:hypothetical protein